MSHTLATPNAPTTLRGWAMRLWNDPDGRSVTIGVLAVLLFHVALLVIGPRVLRFDAIAVRPQTEEQGKFYNIELTPESELKPVPKQPEPSRYVETNPDAPENVPDKTINFAAQNQQVAQEKPTPDGKSDRPAMEGKKDFESNQIVSGRLTNPLENLQAIPPSPEPVQERQTPPTPAQRAEQNPLAGTEKFEGENKDGVGTNIAEKLANAKAVPERVQGTPNAPLVEGPRLVRPTIDPKRPMPRPQLTKTVQTRPAILAENLTGSSNIGLTAIDAKWSEYGEYLRRMTEAVQYQWERILVQWNAYPSRGSTVSVKFVLDSDGRIAQIINVETTANEAGARACVSAITDRAPYGPWSDDMKAVLGEKQEMTFTFHYQ